MLNPLSLPEVPEISDFRLALLEGRFDLDDFILRRLRGGTDVKIKLTAEEIREGIQRNDTDSEIRQAMGEKDPTKARVEEFNLDIEKIEALAFGRAMHMVEKMGLDKDFKETLIYTASFGAMWLDGLFAALSAIEAKPEDQD